MKQVYIFDYGRDWMILLYKDGEEDKYWNSAEDSWDKVLGIVDLLELPSKDIYTYKLDSYEQVCNLVDDVFGIKPEEIKRLEEYRIK